MSETVTLAQPYDWKIGAKKAALAAGKTLAGIAAGAVIQQLVDPASPLYSQFVHVYPTLTMLPPAVAGLVAFLYNGWKQRNR